MQTTRCTILSPRMEFEVDCRGFDRVRDLQARISEIAGFQVQIVCKGRLLDAVEVVSETEIAGGAPIVAIKYREDRAPLTGADAIDGGNVLRHRQVESEQQQHESNHVQQAAEQHDEEDEPICRVCHSGHDAQLGRLFSPCRCIGSMRFIHTECLNRWRRMSVNPQSYWQW